MKPRISRVDFADPLVTLLQCRQQRLDSTFGHRPVGVEGGSDKHRKRHTAFRPALPPSIHSPAMLLTLQTVHSQPFSALTGTRAGDHDHQAWQPRSHPLPPPPGPHRARAASDGLNNFLANCNQDHQARVHSVASPQLAADPPGPVHRRSTYLSPVPMPARIEVWYPVLGHPLD